MELQTHLCLQNVFSLTNADQCWKIKSKEYQLEYNTATLEIKSDAISKDDRVIIIDDLMATGGTMNAAIDIVQELGGNIIACACIMNLTFLPGSSLISSRNIPFYAGVEYS